MANLKPRCFCQRQADADRFLENLRERLGKFELELHSDKTRRIEFDGLPNKTGNMEKVNQDVRVPRLHEHREKNRLGRFTARRKTICKRMLAKLREIKQQLHARMRDPERQAGQWLQSVVQGFHDYAYRENLKTLRVFRDRLLGLWRHTP
jgi:RNA-directed DNA polymerase